MSIGIVKSARWAGRKIGAVIDAEDRVLAAQCVIWGGVLVFAAGALGLAVRVFNMAAG